MSARLYYEEEGIELWCGDCAPWLSTLEAGSVDLVLTDPPYGIGFESPATRGAAPGSRRCSGGSYGRDWGAIKGDDEPFDPSHLLDFPRLILWGAHCYASRLPSSAGWLVWDKKRGGTVAASFNASTVDLAWTNFLGHSLTFSHLWDGMRRDTEVGLHLHPTQKPVALMLWCLKVAGGEGLVVDPYAGSGPVLVACKMLGRPVVACELSEAHCETAANRLRACPRPLFTLPPAPLPHPTLEYAE